MDVNDDDAVDGDVGAYVDDDGYDVDVYVDVGIAVDGDVDVVIVDVGVC